MMTPYSIILIIICLIITLFVITFISYPCSEPKGPKNNVHYYVTKDYFYKTALWLGKPDWDKDVCVWRGYPLGHAVLVSLWYHFEYYKLNLDDFRDMKEGDIREVFINLED